MNKKEIKRMKVGDIAVSHESILMKKGLQFTITEIITESADPRGHFPLMKLRSCFTRKIHDGEFTHKFFSLLENSSAWKNIQDLDPGDFFKKKPEANRTFQRGEYDRSERSYECNDWDDISEFIYLKKNTRVFIDFTF